MSTAAVERQPTAAELQAYAAETTAQQQAATAELVALALLILAGIDMKNPVAWWINSGGGERAYVLVSTLQEMLARDANTYVRRALALQGIAYEGPDIDPLKFAGTAADGRSLESLLAGAVVHIRERQEQGRSDAQALDSARNYLRLVINTEMGDAIRSAESVSLTAAQPVEPPRSAGRSTRESTVGWIRMLTPPSCSRCAVLAGRFYRWSDGFERHPNCDCKHIPVTENLGTSMLTDPKTYFDSLTPQEQDYYFGKAVAQSIRDGADISQVVNASTRPGAIFEVGGRRFTREGTTRKGFYGTREAGQKGIYRPTPWQIYQDATDRTDAVRLLQRFGYLV